MTPRSVLFAALVAALTARPVAKPGYLESYIEPETGFRVTRISGDPGTPIPNVTGERTWSDEVRHHYSLDQAWNADQTLLALDRNRNGCPNLLLDGETLEVVSELPRFPYDSRWHPVKPALRVYIGGRELGYFDVVSKQKTVVATFEDYDRVAFDSKGNVSDDGDRVAVLAQRADGRTVVFAYDLALKIKYPDIVPTRPSPDKFASYQECTISPSGKYIVYNDGQDARTVYDLQGTPIFTTEPANPSHCDLGYDQERNEVLAGRSNFAEYGGRLIMRRLADGLITVINGPDGEKLGCGHVSMRNVERPGWAYCSGVFYPPYEGWVIAVKLDTSGTVEKLCRIFNEWKDYPTEPHASPSRDGKKVVFCSNWGNSTGRPIQAYVGESP